MARATACQTGAGGTDAHYADSQIAAIAATNGLVLVTSNRKDFARFEGLFVEDWLPRSAAKSVSDMLDRAVSMLQPQASVCVWARPCPEPLCIRFMHPPVETHTRKNAGKALVAGGGGAPVEGDDGGALRRAGCRQNSRVQH